jgi:2-methylcitrate dehydratase PrpD
MNTSADLAPPTTTDPLQRPVARALAALAVGIRLRGLTEVETQAATRAVLDWTGATVIGSSLPPTQLLCRAFAAQVGTGRARLVPGGRTLPARTAALINATASHTVEMDDIYREGIYHPGSPTVGAALALGDELGSSGAAVLRAVAVGYEVGDRIAETVNPSHYRFWHTTGTVGTIGAAAAAADLLDLDEDAFAHAIATATTMSAGLQQAFRSDAMSKPLHAGHAAEAGLLAALAAREGYTGALDVLDGPAGFGAGMSDGPDWARAVLDPDRPLGITVPTVKNHSCCGHTFAAVDAALELRAAGVQASRVDRIEVSTYATATKVAGNPNPHTDFEAKFSTAYCVAAALVLGSVRLKAFEPEALADPEIRRLVSRTTLIADEAMEAVFPGRREARVAVTDTSGATREYTRHTRKGDPDDPLTDSELDEKFLELATPVLGVEGASDLNNALWSLAGLASVRDLPFGSER